ncbi:hypothetical protein L202_01850 [Cryptococcus amylolentus CBS 6039]|uniref:Uncharacterized protein n=1 Tax=Cryptococcus amylolentus CBS 6039 TaxID=1295533 RepID=A0A1E3I578_9TREE|nr:hypothetical protein L202_01850 [Cryptococcus amylolentus CBS 6039]ODN83759.1 hypothetical protein L202_01850 [Cryptococcus amylolentus CBS 6039]
MSDHFIEPSPANAATTTYAGVGPLLPLGSGTSTLSSSPNVTHSKHTDDITAREFLSLWFAPADHMDNAAENVTVCLAFGAALFYTAPTQPTTYALLKSYILHKPYTVPPPLNSPPTSSNIVSTPAIVGSTKSPFDHRANVFDRDAVMIPGGWISWGKIDVLRDGFDPALVENGWKVSLSRYIAIRVRTSVPCPECPRFVQNNEEGDGEPLEELWQALLPSFASPPPQSSANLTTVTSPSQNFLSRQLDLLMKDHNRNPSQSFCHTASATSPSNVPFANVPSATNPGAGGFNDTAVGLWAVLPRVRACLVLRRSCMRWKVASGREMMGRREELKDKFARLGRKDGKVAPGTPARAMPNNEALHNLVKLGTTRACWLLEW